MHNLSSSACATICLSWRTAWSASTRQTTPPSLSQSTPAPLLFNLLRWQLTEVPNPDTSVTIGNVHACGPTIET